jgi:flagellar biosynthesis GTPase FlhF
MQLHTFKARSLAEALRLVRAELGPDASVLHTRDIGSPLVSLLGGRRIEVTASAEVEAPSRLPDPRSQQIPAAELVDYRHKIQRDLLISHVNETSLVERLAAASSKR